LEVPKETGIETDKWTDLSRGANSYAIMTNKTLQAEMLIRMINVYDQRDLQTTERRARKFNWDRAIRQGAGTIIKCNMNVQSRR